MKINHLKRYFIGIAMIAFLALLAGNAFADKATTTTATRDFSDAGGTYANNYLVVAPYWQTMGGDSYTFIAVSHSSLSGMASQIGVTINAITSTGAAYDTAETFTVAWGGTQRVFIVPTNHATINSTTVPTAVFLAGTTDFTHGHIRVNAQTSHPQLKFLCTTPGAANQCNTTAAKGGSGAGFRDPTMLTYWGSIIVEAMTTGFAMEFIGDMNDSQAMGVGFGNGYGTGWSADLTTGSGVNLQ